MHHSQGYHYTLDLTDSVYHLCVVIVIVIIGNYIGQNQSHFVVLYNMYIADNPCIKVVAYSIRRYRVSPV